MITKTVGYKSSNGTVHASLEEAQAYELCTLLTDDFPEPDYRNVVAVRLLKQKDQIIDILTMKPNSLPKARKINGGRKSRKHIAEQTTMFSAETPKPAA